MPKSKYRSKNKTVVADDAPVVANAVVVADGDAMILQNAAGTAGMPDVVAQDANAVTLHSLTNAITLEVVAYVLIGIAALLLRVMNLDVRPLAPAEAKTALAAWEFLNGKPVSDYASPLLFTLDWLAFLAFGAFDLTARVLPAALSAALIFVPLLARNALGRTGAIIAAFVIAFSPTLMFFGRTLGAADLAVGAMLSALILFWNFRELQNTRALYAAAILAALALTADATAYAILVSGALYLVIAWLWNRRAKSDDANSADDAEVKLVQNPYVRAAVLFVLTYVLSATTLLLNRDGLGVAFNLLGVWLSALAGIGAFSSPLNLLAVYEPLALIFGLAGVVLVLSLRGDDAAGLGLLRMLSVIAVFTFVWYSLGSDKMPSNVIAVALPLMLLAGWFVGTLLERARAEIQTTGGWQSMLTGEIPILLLLLLLSGLIYFQVGAFLAQTRFSPALDALYRLVNANSPELSLTAAMATLFVITGMLVAIFIGLSIVLVGVGRTMTLLALTVFVLLSLGMVRAAWLLNFSAQEPLREIIATPQTPQHIRLLVRDLEWYSQIRNGDAHEMRIAADEQLGAVGRWYLRDFPYINWTNQINRASEAQAIVSPAPEPPPGNWMGQRYRTSADWTLSNAGGIDLWKWFMFRQGGNETSQTTMLWLPSEQ